MKISSLRSRSTIAKLSRAEDFRRNSTNKLRAKTECNFANNNKINMFIIIQTITTCQTMQTTPTITTLISTYIIIVKNKGTIYVIEH